VILGIDLGTTNSAAAIWRNGAPELIPNRLGHVLTPSAVSIDEAGHVLVGLPARERQATHAGQTVTAFKRFMGTNRNTRLGNRDFLPEELSALVLRSLKQDAEAHLGEPVTEAVITVPAYFNDKQRKATRRAGERAGLKVERLLNEPTAAALAYGIHQLALETKFLVFDLGGGTFDVSILEIFEGVIEVRASTGDNRLGGEDFNELLIDAMRARFAKEWGEGPRQNDTLRQKLREAAERARRAFTDQPSAKMQIVWRERTFELEITAAEFEASAAPLLARLREPVLRSLRDSRLDPQAMNEIILVGGATRMPLIRRAVTKMFGRFPSTTVNPDEAVALGAAIQAGLKARDAALREVAITDVCPYSLGVDIGERGPGGAIKRGIFSPILERNIVVPASRVKSFTTLEDGQKKIKLGIYQGESRLVAENIHLGAIEINLPPKPAGAISVDCRFTYDINGLIEVDVFVPETKVRQQLVIVDEDGPKGEDLARQRAALAALKVHPRETEGNRALLARAGRCYEDQLGERRAAVGHMVSQFEATLEGQDPRAIEQARKEFAAALDQMEGEVYF